MLTDRGPGDHLGTFGDQAWGDSVIAVSIDGIAPELRDDESLEAMDLAHRPPMVAAARARRRAALDGPVQGVDERRNATWSACVHHPFSWWPDDRVMPKRETRPSGADGWWRHPGGLVIRPSTEQATDCRIRGTDASTPLRR